MGVFDFLKRGARSGDTGEPSRGNLQVEEPRDHHYVFTHIALRQIAFKNPVGCVGVLHSPDAMKFLAELWDEVGKHCQDGGAGGHVDGSTLGVRPARVGNFPSAIVSLPEPLAPTEAYFIAMVLHVDLPTLQGEGPTPEDPQLSYYTLECGVSFEAESRTVLCAWNAEEAHLNYGDGPPPDFDSFVDAVRRQVGGDGADLKAAFRPFEDGASEGQDGGNGGAQS